MNIIKSGLRDIKTTTGLIGAKKIRKPHEAYLELSSLEMERHRLNKEKEKAESRTKDINKRFEEIDKKEAALLEFIERPTDFNNGSGKNDNKEKPIPSYKFSPADIKERIITY